MKTHRIPAPRRNQECNTSHPSTASTNDGGTRRNKRKASPEKKTQRKRARLSEFAELSEEAGKVRREKRKVREDEEEPTKKATKKRKLDLSQHENNKDSVDTEREGSSNPLEGCSNLVGDLSKTSAKRKADTEGEGPKSKNRRYPDQKETKKKTKLSADALRAQFQAKYKEEKVLGKGGCGFVFAGYRKADNLPVAIKHIPKEKVFCKQVDQNGKHLSVEVAVMIKLAATTSGSVGSSASISLVDWYDLGHELILVLERPVPCNDLLSYTEVNGGTLQEEEAKIILKQLVAAAVELEDNHIFHRDIKMENILIETGSDVPRVRLIDFGLSCFFKKRSLYRVFYGTPAYTPPEWYSRWTYRAGPTTVWQLGVVLFETLHHKTQFDTCKFLTNKLKISNNLSTKCQDFLKLCLTKIPEQRPTLKELQHHPWLR